MALVPSLIRSSCLVGKIIDQFVKEGLFFIFSTRGPEYCPASCLVQLVWKKEGKIRKIRKMVVHKERYKPLNHSFESKNYDSHFYSG